jgi:hypothetical protein
MRRYAPVFVLFVLSTFIGEVVLGATTLSRIGGLLVVTPLYGGGAVLIRELARRRGPGLARVAMLAAAYGVIEEGLAIQSLFNPDLFNAGLLGGRWLGVNWVWATWTLGYHIVWSITIPIWLTELLFAAQRDTPWLRRAGVAVAGLLYAAGAVAVGAIFRLVVAPSFRAPLALNLAAALVAAVLATLALAWPARASKPSTRSGGAPAAWLVGLTTMLAALAWFVLLDLPHPLRAGALPLAPIAAELAIALAAAGLLRRWSAAERGWSDMHRLATATGPLLVTMLVGFFFVTASNPVDQLGQAIASALALVLLVLFALKLRQRGPRPAEARRDIAAT